MKKKIELIRIKKLIDNAKYGKTNNKILKKK